jgi:predicted MFS family arabinose efflux permease
MDVRRETSPLATRGFRFFLAGRVFSEIGARVSREGMPVVAILAVGARAPELGLLAVVAALPALALGPFAGLLADAWPRRRIMIATSVLQALTLAAVPISAYAHRLTFGVVLAVTLVNASLQVFFTVADQSFFPALVSRAHLMAGNALLATASGVGETTGPLLMGLLVRWLGAPAAIGFDVVARLTQALTLAGLRAHPEQHLDRPRPRTSFLADLTAGVGVVWRHPWLRPIALAMAGTAFFGGVFATLYELYVLEVLRLGPLALGALVTLGGVGALVGSALARPLVRRRGLRRTLRVSFLVSALCNLFLPLAHGPFLLAFACLFGAQFFGDMAGTVFEVNELVVRQSTTADEVLGRVNGAIGFALGLSSVLGAFMAGLVAPHIGVRGSFLVNALGDIAIALGLWFAPTLRRLPSPAETPPATALS